LFKGRKHVFQNSKGIKYKGNDLERPIASYENKTLVRFLVPLSKVKTKKKRDII